MASRQVARHPRLDLTACSYHSSSGTPMTCKSALMTSLHLLLGPPLGRGCGNQPKRHLFEIRLSGIRARWPSHSRRRAVTFSENGVGSPQRRLTCDVMCCAHCYLLEIPEMVLTHLWWNESSFLLCFLRGIQHSDDLSLGDADGEPKVLCYLHILTQCSYCSVSGCGEEGSVIGKLALSNLHLLCITCIPSKDIFIILVSEIDPSSFDTVHLATHCSTTKHE